MTAWPSTSEGSAAARFLRRSMLTQGAYQVDSASELTKLGQERVRTGGKRIERPPAMTPEQVEQCRRMADEGAGLRHIARVDAVVACDSEEGTSRHSNVVRNVEHHLCGRKKPTQPPPEPLEEAYLYTPNAYNKDSRNATTSKQGRE